MDEFDVDENYSHISVADKWRQQKSDRRDKVKSSIRTPLASVVSQSDNVVGGGSGVSHSASGTTATSGSPDVISQRQFISLKDTIFCCVC